MTRALLLAGLLLASLPACKGGKSGDDTAAGDGGGSGDGGASADGGASGDGGSAGDGGSSGDGGGDTGDGGADTGGDEPPDDAMAGKIILMDDRGEGEVIAWRAFSYTDGSTTLVYVSPNPEADCDTVADYLGRPDSSGQPQVIDPSSLFLQDYCNLSFTATGSLPMEVDLEEDAMSLIVTATCSLGEGTFDYTTVGDQTGYFWSGTWYTGTAYQGVLSVSLDGDDVRVSGSIDSIDGTYPLEDGGTKARSTVDGVVYAENCSALGDTPVF